MVIVETESKQVANENKFDGSKYPALAPTAKDWKNAREGSWIKKWFDKNGVAKSIDGGPRKGSDDGDMLG